LLLAFRLREILDSEALVFRLGYRCQEVSDDVFEILPPDDRWGVALNLGYRNVFILPLLRVKPVEQARSFVNICHQFVERLGPALTKFVPSGPEEQLRLEVPDQVAKWFGQQFLTRTELFREEAEQLQSICQSLLTTPDHLLHLQLSPNLTVLDVFRIRRVIHLFAIWRSEALARRNAERAALWN